MRNIAICSTAVAMVAPAVAQAQDPASIALAGQVTVVIDGAFLGTTGPLNAASLRQVEMAIKGLTQQAAAGGLTYQQISWALSRGLHQSAAPRVLVASISNGLKILAHDTWAYATGAVEVLKNLPLPTPLLMIIVDPAMDGSGAELPMAQWGTFDDNYYEPDYGDYEDGGEVAYNSGSEGGGSDGGTTVTVGNGNDDSSPGGDRPKTKYDSESHQDGYWTAAGCFPPVPDVHHYLSDVMVPCTGYEVEAPIVSVPAVDIQSMRSYMVEAHVIPFGAEGEGVLLLPVEESPGLVPTIVHFF